MKMEAASEQMIEQFSRMLPSMLPKETSSEDRAKLEGIHRKVLEYLKRSMSWQRMKPYYMKIYEDVFTIEEVDGMTSFYSSPVGQSTLKKMPLMVQRSSALFPQLMAGMMPEIQRIVKEPAVPQ